jgi:hypothetical protein
LSGPADSAGREVSPGGPRSADLSAKVLRVVERVGGLGGFRP